MRATLVIFATALAGCSILVPGPDDFTYDLADAGADGGVDAGARIDAGNRDGGAETDSGPADAGPDAGCRAGELSCGGACTDTQMSVEHCGRCGAPCDPGWVCRSGECHDDPVQVSAAPNHTCARLGSGSVWCWGRNETGQLGVGDFSDSPVPRAVVDLEDAVDISAGGSPFGGWTGTTCAARESSEVWCWGRNDRGQVGDGTTDIRNRPTRVAGLSGAISVDTGGAYACAGLSPAPRMLCWGERPGTAGMTIDLPPAAIPGWPSSAAPATQIEASLTHACLVSDGVVYCWGENTQGQLGDGTTDSRAFASPVLGLDDVVQIAVNPGTTCARQSTGQVWCWGKEDFLGLGRTTTSAEPNPQRLPMVTAATGLFGGSHAFATCVTDTAGAIACWGVDLIEFARLGMPVMAPEPVTIAGTSDVTSVSVASHHACALTTDGISCWGGNASGQLGDGTTDTRLSPTHVVGLP